MAKTTDPLKLAQRRVKKVKDFWAHFFSFVITCLFLLAINLLTSPGFIWALFPILGWGLGLTFHAFDVFGYPGFGKDWEQRMLEKERKRLEGEKEDTLELPELKKQKDPETLYRDDELV